MAEQNSKGVEFLMKKNKVTVIKGTGTLLPGPQGQGRRRRARGEEGGRHRHRLAGEGHSADRARASTRPPSSAPTRRCSSEQAPKTLAVVGAGAVGCEFADIFNAFGTKVTLIEALPRILPIEDAECSDAVAKGFRKRGIDGPGGRQGARRPTVRQGLA